MMLKIKRFIKSLFSKRFIHPVVNEKLSTAIDDKLKARVKAQEAESEIHTQKLNGFLRAYFGKKYDSPEVMNVAFEFANKEWNKYCREVNSRSKLLNLDKNAFKKRVELTVKLFKESKRKTEAVK